MTAEFVDTVKVVSLPWSLAMAGARALTTDLHNRLAQAHGVFSLPFIFAIMTTSSGFLNGDYFIDCKISQSLARAIFGVWIEVCITVVGLCVRSIYQSRVRGRMLSTHSGGRGVSLLLASPATTVPQFFEMRSVILRGLSNREHLFVLTSLACVFLAIISAASTAITNRTIVSNTVTRQSDVSGAVVGSDWADGIVPVSTLTARVAALDNAGAPLEELLDFAPDDTAKWVYVKDEWDNSWRGQCDYRMHPAVELAVFPTDETRFQAAIPALGTVLPLWAANNESTAQDMYQSCYSPAARNETGAFRDCLLTFAFNNPPDGPFAYPSNNISLVNVLLHEIGTNATGYVVQTAFKSDVHVVECAFANAYPGREKRARGGGILRDTVISVDQFYHRDVMKASIAQKPVVQPTARRMLRIWQAYQSAKDAGSNELGQRPISVSKAVVQIRLSVLVFSVGVFVTALAAAGAFHFMEPRDSAGRRVPSPSSQVDWIVQAVRECKGGEQVSTDSQAVFSAHRDDLAYVVSLTPEGEKAANIIPLAVPKGNNGASDGTPTIGSRYGA